jgi:protein SCO1/2
MSFSSATFRWVLRGGVAVLILFAFASFFTGRSRDSQLLVYSQIGDFILTNQLGRSFKLADLQGKVWIANVIFTRCSGPCAHLTSQMHQMQKAFPETAPVRFISLTADPEYDTPEVLRQYADRFQADDTRWFFLTGTKSNVYSLATKELKFAVVDNEADRKPDQDLFIHSQKFVVGDRLGRIRGYIEGNESGTVSQVTRTVRILLKEKGQ